MKKISFSWILMWSISYISCSIVKPEIAHNVPKNVAMFFLFSFGVSMLVGLIFDMKPLLFLIGIGEVVAGIISWVGILRWSVPWIPGYDSLAQISMAMLDLVGAFFLFFYSFEVIEKLVKAS